MAAFGNTYSANSGVIKESKRQAKIAEDRELDRQARLEYGRALVDALFKGGSYSGIKLNRKDSEGKTIAYDPKATYYTRSGEVWKPKAQTKGNRKVTRYKDVVTGGRSNQYPVNSQNTRVYGSGGAARLAGTSTPVAALFPGSLQGAGNWYRDSEGDIRQMPVGKPFYDNSGDLRYDSGNYALSPATRAASSAYLDNEGDVRYGIENLGGNPTTTRTPYTAYETFFSGPTAAEQFADANLYSNRGGEFSGIGDDFYDSYRNAILDYQLPDLQKQFGKAKDLDLFSMARQGIARSTAANERAVEREAERLKNETNIRSGAEDRVATLEGDVDAARRRTIALVESTESPTRAINEGLTEINAITSRPPELTPLGDLFTAGAQAAQSYSNTQRQRMYNDILLSRSPNKGSGRTYV